MKVGFHANVYESSTERVARLLQAPLKKLGAAMTGEYGGPMDHLLVGIELLPTYSTRPKPWPFRFQKRVSGRSPHSGLPSMPDKYNVGHYSVGPDFSRLLSLPEDQVVPYVLDLLLASFDELGGKKNLKGFDIAAFKAAFVEAAKSLEEPRSANGA